ncbi:MAG: hypothetical protein RBT64_02120 [Trichloromonas sp.]|jgi:hypothetical protein|nr:hypothetical protein [Trichloromonas sp.]
MGISHRTTILALGALAVYVGLTVVLALPLLGLREPAEDLRLDAIDHRRGEVGKPLPLQVKGAGFDGDTRFTLVLDSGNQQAIVQRIPTFALVHTLLKDGQNIYLGTADRRLWRIGLNRPEIPHEQQHWSLSSLTTALLKTGETLWAANGQGVLSRISSDGQIRQSRKTNNIIDLAEGPENTLLVAAGKQGLLVFPADQAIDIPSPTGALPFPGAALAVTCSGHLVFVGTVKSGLYICDLTDPANPRLLAQHPLPGFVQNITLHGPLALVATSAGLSIVDVQNPHQPQTLKNFALGKVFQVLAEGDRAYLAMGTLGLLQIDIRDPLTPQITGHLTPGDSVRRFALDGERAYLGTDGGELLVVDLGRLAGHPDWRPAAQKSIPPFRPSSIGIELSDEELENFLTRSREQLPSNCSVNELAYNANALYLATDCGLASLPRGESAELQRPQQTLATVTGLWLTEKTLYAYGEKTALESASVSVPRQYGVEIFSLEAPRHPQSIGFIATPDAVTQLQHRDDRLYLTVAQQGVRIYDVHDPRRSQALGAIQLPWPEQAFADAQHFHLGNELLYLATGRSGLQVFDVSDSNRPQRIGALNVPGGRLIRIGGAGDHLFVYNQTGDLQLYDIANPRKPLLIGSLDRIAGLQTLEIAGKKLSLSFGGYSKIERALPLAAEKLDLKSSAHAELVFSPPVFPGDYRLYAFDVRGRQVLADLIRVEEPQK